MMGKHGKKQSHQHQQRRGRRAFSYNQEEEEPDCAEEQRDVEESENGHESPEEEEEEEGGGGRGRDNEFNQSPSNEEAPSKFLLYQQSVQVWISPLNQGNYNSTVESSVLSSSLNA